jgi:hypothetical protein
MRPKNIILLPVAILIFAILIAGCGDKVADRKKHYDRGMEFVKKEKYPDAIIEFRNALENSVSLILRPGRLIQQKKN